MAPNLLDTLTRLNGYILSLIRKIGSNQKLETPEMDVPLIAKVNIKMHVTAYYVGL